jgi:hypothetical protein
LDKKEEKLLRQLEVLRRHMKNVKEQMEAIKRDKKVLQSS